ncbi:MAG: FG-GAP repeat domain-containing protein, partial [Crocinitomicaceae bacterium]
MKICTFFVVLLIANFLRPQFNFSFKDSIPVSVFGVDLQFPWAGGLNNTQFSDLDFDYDGDLDLLIFDRSSDQIRLFENLGNTYVPYFNASTLFPSDIRYRLFSIDYNQDGKNDLFTYGIGGIKVYKNTGNSSTGLQWSVAKNLLYSDNWGTMLNLYVSSADIPAIVDVDNDGDIDVLTYHIGGEYLQYHKNLSQELYGHSDSLQFELRNECWGGFREDVNSNSVFLNDQTPPCQGGNVPNPEFKPNDQLKAHAGSTVLAFDYDGSGVKDLLLGDVAHPNLILLTNGGATVNSNSLIINQDSNFPSNSIQANIQLFPASFWLDVDFDGNKDLLVAPNAKNVSENEKSVLMYKNTGTNSANNFVFQTKAFLQEDMIEHGTGSIPVFCDIDNDGLIDMFVANFYAYKPTLLKESRIAYYKNTGTNTQPFFTLVDSDFLNLASSLYGLRIIPSFGDLNGDGKKDMILGFENGTIGFFKNTSVGSSISFASPVLNLNDANGSLISAGQYACPQLVDLNKDGVLDLVLGKKTGEILYYRNTSGTSFNFILENSQLGMIDVATDTPDGYAVPHFFEYSDSLFLLVGCADGKLRYYKNISDSLNQGQSFQQLSDDYLAISREIGAYSAPFVLDMDSDGNLDLFIGQDAGGIFHLENGENGGVGLFEDGKENDMLIIPNPF